LIGLPARIISSTHESHVGVKGSIIMESRNMIVIKTDNSSVKRIPKNSVVLEVTIPDNGKVKIDGVKIVGRPENRIKKRKI
jgi:ribonuclease P protein subunit POP4